LKFAIDFPSASSYHIFDLFNRTNEFIDYPPMSERLLVPPRAQPDPGPAGDRLTVPTPFVIIRIEATLFASFPKKLFHANPLPRRVLSQCIQDWAGGSFTKNR
jgi:hypothetical protein